jgi:DNA-binding GntR family transcriptional regulator
MDIIKRDDSEGLPKYVQLSKILKEKIASGEYQADQPIPTEKDLCSQHQVSRITVRQAINTLVQEKMLYREQGRGTYVLPQKLKRDILKIYSFTNDMQNLGSRLVEEDLVQGSLYRILAENYNLIPRHAEESYEAVIMSEHYAKLLQCKSTRNSKRKLK